MSAMLEPQSVPPRALVADADLLRRVIQRDSTALIELERRHSASLYAQAYGILMDSGLAERVVSEVFAQLWYAAGRFITKHRNLWTWLRELAKDLARAELMLQEPRYSHYSAAQRREHEAHAVARPGALAPARATRRAEPSDGDSELPRIRYRQGESGRGDGAPRDACTW
jgi:DNA-directed RNA polymerase specialized sigma24 family protein